MPVCLYLSSFLFCCFVFEHETLYYTSVRCVWLSLSYVSLQSNWSVKTFKTRTVHFVFSLRIFVSAHVIITSITAPSTFTHLCLVLLLLFTDSPVPKFHFQWKKKKLEKSPRKGRTWFNLAYGITALVKLHVLYSHRAPSFNQWRRALYPNFIIKKMTLTF